MMFKPYTRPAAALVEHITETCKQGGKFLKSEILWPAI